MTMYVALFRQGQSAVSAMLAAVGGMYEDNLYLSTLYEYLETAVAGRRGTAVRGPHPEDGMRFEDVSFTYPGCRQPALEHITLHLVPGTSLALVGENGSGKTTLIKLLTRLYAADLGAHPARRPRPRRVGRGGAARAHRRHLPGLRALPDAGRRERRRGR